MLKNKERKKQIWITGFFFGFIILGSIFTGFAISDGRNDNIKIVNTAIESEVDLLASCAVQENDIWAQSKMVFNISDADTYYTKVEYRVNSGSWTTKRWASSYYSLGTHTLYDNCYQYSANDYVEIRWSIYSSNGITLLDQRTEGKTFS